MNPIRIIGIALLVLGVALGYMGYQESESVASKVSEAVTGTGTDRSMTLIIGGVISFVVGLVLSVKK